MALLAGAGAIGYGGYKAYKHFSSKGTKANKKASKKLSEYSFNGLVTIGENIVCGR